MGTTPHESKVINSKLPPPLTFHFQKKKKKKKKKPLINNLTVKSCSSKNCARQWCFRSKWESERSILASPGLELETFSMLNWRDNQLHHDTICFSEKHLFIWTTHFLSFTPFIYQRSKHYLALPHHKL
jgi:hypothetical protein